MSIYNISPNQHMEKEMGQKINCQVRVAYVLSRKPGMQIHNILNATKIKCI